MSRIIHTEASTGFGGQEIRILKEAIGLRKRGHELFFAVQTGGVLAQKARQQGFPVYELNFDKIRPFSTLFSLSRIFKSHAIDIVNTHSSSDAWLAGIAARLSGRKLIRTRHLSTPPRSGLNSIFLYGFLADITVTTCLRQSELIQKQARLTSKRCLSVPTGIDPEEVTTDGGAQAFRQKYGLLESDFVVGSLSVLRSWKGVQDLIRSAKHFQEEKVTFLIVGSGPYELKLKELVEEEGLQSKIVFTGYLDNPYPALAAMDVFALLSTANEGVSQASLQAALLGKPLITTPTGGLDEVCLEGVTGLQVPCKSPESVAHAILRLKKDLPLCKELGANARQLVLEKFTMQSTLDQMEAIVHSLQKV